MPTTFVLTARSESLEARRLRTRRLDPREHRFVLRRTLGARGPCREGSSGPKEGGQDRFVPSSWTVVSPSDSAAVIFHCHIGKTASAKPRETNGQS